MLSLRRRPETEGSSDESIIDIKFKDEVVTITLIYGSKITEDGQAVMHLSAPREVIIERRDRASYNDN